MMFFIIPILAGALVFILIKVIYIFKDKRRNSGIISDVAAAAQQSIFPREAAGLEEKMWYEEELSFLFNLTRKYPWR